MKLLAASTPFVLAYLFAAVVFAVKSNTALLAQGACPGSCPASGSCPVTCPSGIRPNGNDPLCHWTHQDLCRYGQENGGCPSGQTPYGVCCYFVTSPIILDLKGDGFEFTDAGEGVLFRTFQGDPNRTRMSWTAKDSDDAWLVLDRNGNGVVDDMTEMFGNLTAQPAPPTGQQRNGFLALAVFDRPAEGGNGDGWISKSDAIFSRLRVWQDRNHDGVSQPEELKDLEAAGVAAISLRYSDSQSVDQFGNAFRYKSTLRNMVNGDADKVIYDVLLLTRAEGSE